MPAVPRSEERKLFVGLKKFFGGIIERLRNGELNEAERDIAGFINSDKADRYLQSLVSRMAKNIRVSSARSWREAARKGSNGRKLFDAMKNEMRGPVGQRIWELIADNVAYIKTVPQEWAEYITRYTANESIKGKRPAEIEAELRKIMPAHITKNLKTIARTECAKANAAIVQARAEAAGLRCYFWRCVGDERTREAHRLMNHVLVFYDDPPSPEALAGEKYVYGSYHAGNIFNCRCYQEVVVDGRFLPDTFKFYLHGSIQTTTRGAFLKQFGNIS